MTPRVYAYRGALLQRCSDADERRPDDRLFAFRPEADGELRRHRWRHSLVAIVVTLISISVAGCSTATNQPSAGATKTVTARPSTVGTLNSRLVAKISVPNPDGLVEVGGAVWVKTDDGSVVRIDPRTDTVTGTVHLDTATDPAHYCQGIGTDGTAVWACTAGDSTTGIVRLDPTTMAKERQLPSTRSSTSSRCRTRPVACGCSPAGVTPSPSSILQAKRRCPTRWAARCQQLAASSAVIVATCANDDVAVALDPATGRVRTRVPLAAPRIAAVTGHDVWVDTSHGLTRLGADLKVRAVYPRMTLGLAGDLSIASDGALWARGPGGVLWRIDPTRNIVSDQLNSSPALSAGSLMVTTNALWTSANNEDFVLHLRLAD